MTVALPDAGRHAAAWSRSPSATDADELTAMPTPPPGRSVRPVRSAPGSRSLVGNVADRPDVVVDRSDASTSDRSWSSRWSAPAACTACSGRSPPGPPQRSATATWTWPTAFANQASVAIELADARAEQQRAALLDDRDRIAADLHDHVIQRLFAAGLSLQSVAARLDHRPRGPARRARSPTSTTPSARSAPPSSPCVARSRPASAPSARG